jgi:hypothetical protein
MSMCSKRRSEMIAQMGIQNYIQLQSKPTGIGLTQHL